MCPGIIYNEGSQAAEQNRTRIGVWGRVSGTGKEGRAPNPGPVPPAGMKVERRREGSVRRER